MAAVDKTAIFADAAVVTISAVSSTYELGRVPTLRSASVAGQYLVIEVLETFTPDGGDPATHIEFSLESDSSDTLASTPTVHWESGLLAVDVTAGTQIIVPLPVSATYERYLGVYCDVTGGSPGAVTGGVYTAYLTTTPPLHTVYPNEF